MYVNSSKNIQYGLKIAPRLFIDNIYVWWKFQVFGIYFLRIKTKKTTWIFPSFCRFFYDFLNKENFKKLVSLKHLRLW